MKRSRPPWIRPRNPLVAPARLRRAGAHGQRGASRQAARERLRKEIANWKDD